MKKGIKLFIGVFIIIISWSFNSNNSFGDNNVTVEMVTDSGTMVIELYNETPLHRDNFIKLVKEGAYDGLLFHRVIETFMIQGGDPESRNAKPGVMLGNGDVGYMVDAEFRADLFHKKGALAAARDGNLERASSGIQFYIVQGKVYNDSLLDAAEVRINQWLAEYYVKKDPKYNTLVESLQQATDDRDREKYMLYNDSIVSIAKTYTNFERYSIPEDQRMVYKTLGGTPALDQNYTVFGEVISGLEVIDLIAAVPTDANNRPIMDVRIISVKVLKND